MRIPYDRALTDRLFHETGFLAGGGAMTRIVLAELRTSRSLTYDWAVSYQDGVLSGGETLAESVTRYLTDLGFEDI